MPKTKMCPGKRRAGLPQYGQGTLQGGQEKSKRARVPSLPLQCLLLQELRFQRQIVLVQILAYGLGLAIHVSVWEELSGNYQLPGLNPSSHHQVSTSESCGQPTCKRQSLPEQGEHHSPPL